MRYDVWVKVPTGNSKGGMAWSRMAAGVDDQQRKAWESTCLFPVHVEESGDGHDRDALHPLREAAGSV